MSRRKKTVPAFDADGPHPMRGGAFVRLPDGSLVRDTSEDQHIPEDEGGAEPEPEPERGAEADFVGFNEDAPSLTGNQQPPATQEGF